MKMIEVSIDELLPKAEAALIEIGATEDEARIVAADYLDADLRGRTSHGFASFAVALGQFPKAGEFEVAIDDPSKLHILGNGDCGHIVARKAIDLAESKVEKTGHCLVGITNITRFACPGTIARYAGEKGMVAIVLEYGGKNFMTPPGGKVPVLSTNPIGIAIPVKDKPMFVLDMATSERAIGYVGLAKDAGEEIPKTWAVDSEGNPTSDPTKVSAVLPFGGTKGFGLATAFEILSGALVGVGIGSNGDLASRGAVMVLISPQCFGVTSFDNDSSQFLSELLDVPTVASRSALYAGIHGQKEYDASRKMGHVRIPNKVALEFGIPAAAM